MQIVHFHIFQMNFSYAVITTAINNDVMTNAEFKLMGEERDYRQGHNIYSTKINSYFIIQFYLLFIITLMNVNKAKVV